MEYRDEIQVGFSRKTKIKKTDRKLPVIDFQKRVINFGDDLVLFKIVAVLIMKRVDLDPDDLEPLFDGHDLGSVPAIDLDDISDRADRHDFDTNPVRGGLRPAPRTLSERFGIRWDRGNNP